ncbi:hypothetical protein FOCG_16298 [Fusarium oxysporum f. sp. radicis-lycopersici 26381]|nr:hypothetical protein FOCG_16298 [Fusarium oxysporum f. sp. radicis-lycopersici 26381]
MLSSEIRLNASGLLAVGPAKVEQFLTPELVKFVIGSKKTEFNLHLSLVSFLSTRLCRLIENSRQCIYLKDVDEDVFSRFSQFVYSGSYVGFGFGGRDVSRLSDKDTEAGIARQSSSKVLSNTEDSLLGNEGAHEPPSSCPDSLTTSKPHSLFGSSLVRSNDGASLGLFGQPLRSTTPNPKPSPMKLPFSFVSCANAITTNVSCAYCSQDASKVRVPSKRKQIPAMCSCELPEQIGNKQQFISDFIRTHIPTAKPRQSMQTKITPHVEDFKHVLIGHVRLCNFAQEYAVSSLMDLACENLVWELVHWVMSERTFVPIFGGLIRFVYSSCHIQGGKLRRILANFAACVLEDVCLLEGWHELITEVPSFAVDMVCKLADRCV